jgi:hypothetical protein
MGAIEDLKGLYDAHRLIPFIGAGVSASVEWDGGTKRGPSWKEMVDQACHLLGFEDPELLRTRGTDLQILEYFKHCNNEEVAKLTNWLVRNMQPPDDALKSSPIHSQLAQMDRCSLFYTTNYDSFIERSFSLHRRTCRTVAAEAHIERHNNNAEIIKFHGDFDNPGVMVLTESDYEDRLSFNSAMDLRLFSDLLNRTVLFIGYSFRDPNVAYLFRRINSWFDKLPDSESGRRAYIIVSEPSDFERRLFRARNIEVISVGPNLTSAVAELLEEIRG